MAISMITGSQRNSGAQGISLAVEYPLVEYIKAIGTEDGEDGDGKTLKGKEDRLMESMGTKIFKYTLNQRVTLKDIISHSWVYHWGLGVLFRTD